MTLTVPPDKKLQRMARDVAYERSQMWRSHQLQQKLMAVGLYASSLPSATLGAGGARIDAPSRK